jgi:hypothetical protein
MTDETPESAPRFTRRHLFAIAAATGAAGALATGGRVWTWWDRPATDGYRMLSAHEVELVESTCEAIFPPGGIPAIGGRDVGAARYVDDVLGGMVEPTGNLLRLVLHAMDDWSRLTRRRGWASLAIDERGEALQSWSRNSSHLVRGAVTGLTIFICAAYVTHPEVRESAGWQFPCGYER